MQQKQIEQMNNVPSEQNNVLKELNEAITKLKVLFYPNNNQQLIVPLNNCNLQQQIKIQQRFPLNLNQEEENFNIFSQFSNPNTDPSSQQTNISTMTKCKQKLNELFPQLLKAQEIINREWNELEKYKLYYIQTQGLLKILDDQQSHLISIITSSGIINQQIFKFQLSNLQQSTFDCLTLLKQLQLGQNDIKKDQNLRQNLTFQQKKEIKKQFSDLIQKIQNSNYLDDEVVILDEYEIIQQEAYEKKKQYFKPIPLSLEENVNDRYNKDLRGIEIQENWRNEIVFPIFYKMDQIQRILLRIQNYCKQSQIDLLQNEIQNCILQMEQNYQADLKIAVLCLRFSKLFIQSMFMLFNRVEQIDELLIKY